ncbi:transmembrane protein 272-like [Liolophura sinensis]|uniref:transmembrane protein 272-like n=1 Tax=Liolophura sinensis TaxID=3198878 RepID=UPI003158E15D
MSNHGHCKPLVEEEYSPSSVVSEKPGSVYGTADNVPPAYAAEDKAPPSYASLRNKLRESRIESQSTFQFLWKLIVLVLCGTVGYILIVTLMFLLPIAMITMGALYFHQCSVEPYIPIYLIVMGSFSLFQIIVNIVLRYRKQPSSGEYDDEAQDRMRPFEVLITCFILGWFIAGNVWIYRTYGMYQWTDKAAANYCNRELYLFSFWITSAIYIMFACLCCCGIIASVITYCCLGD